MMPDMEERDAYYERREKIDKKQNAVESTYLCEVSGGKGDNTWEASFKVKAKSFEEAFNKAKMQIEGGDADIVELSWTDE